MRIVTWNLNFWRNWKKKSKQEWKENVLEYLNNLNYDFLLLQEVNSDFLFGNEDDIKFSQIVRGAGELIAAKTGYKPGYGPSITYNYKDFVYYHELDLEEIGVKCKSEGDILP
jgi:hypothetical protein